MLIKKFGKIRRDEVQQWYEQHGPGLVAYASALLGKRSDAEDVVQQVFLKLLKGDVNVHADAVKPYLFRAVRNTGLNLIRGDRDVVVVKDEGVEQSRGWFESPADLIHLRGTLENAIRSLPTEQSEVLTMKIWGEMTFEEIAAVLDISVNTAASRYRYAICKLRELMPLDGGTNE